MKFPKIFFSYSTKDRELASSVRDCLATSGFDVFLAHSTLVPSVEWRKDIKQELVSREIFLVLLTPHAKESDWVDQEVGIAIALGKTIIPLQAPVQPYGFAGDYHAVRLDPRNPWQATEGICRGILTKHPEIGDAFRVGTIRRICESHNFHDARNALLVLQGLVPPLTRGERRKIYRASRTNGQIGGFSEVTRFVSELASEFGAKGR